MKKLASILGLALVLASAGTARAYITTSPGGGGSSSGPTNGQTEAEVSANIAGSAILKTNGIGTNTTLGTLTVLQGKYKNFYFANGAMLRTNTVAPFDWYFYNTNGTWAFGTNTVTKGGITAAGDLTLPTSNGGTITAKAGVFNQLISAAGGGFSVNQLGVVANTFMAAESGKTNLVLVLPDGTFQTNDFATFVASLGGGGGGSAIDFQAGLGSGTNNVKATNGTFGGTLAADSLRTTNQATLLGSIYSTALTPDENVTNFVLIGPDGFLFSATSIPSDSVSGLLVATNINPNTYGAFDANGNLTSTVDGSNWTHLVTSPAGTDTNLVAQKSTGALTSLSLSNMTYGIAHGQTNLSAGSITATNTVGASNYLGGFSYVQTNVAPVTTFSNPTNQYARSTLYSNGAYRSLLVGATVGNAGDGSASQTLLYTNNGVGYALPIVDLTSGAKQIQTFCVPLSPGASFFFNTSLSGSGTADLTNVVNWIQ